MLCTTLPDLFFLQYIHMMASVTGTQTAYNRRIARNDWAYLGLSLDENR